MRISFDLKNLFEIAFLCVVAYIIYQARTVVIVAIFGFLLAYMLNPVVVKMERLRIRRPVGTLFILLTAVLTVTGAGFYLIPQLYSDIQNFVRQIPSYMDALTVHVNSIAARFSVDLSSIELYDEVLIWLRQRVASIIQWMGGLVGSVQQAFGITMNIVLVPMIAFFLLVDYPRIQTFADNYMGTSNASGVRKYFHQFSVVMASYFRGQFIVVLVLCVLYSTALKIVGLDTAILLGGLSGLLSIVPYLGFAIGVVLSIIMAAIQFQDLAHPLFVIAGYAVVQAIESFVVTPRIMGESLGLHPVATIIVLMIGGVVFGLLGMIFALPIAAIFFQIYKEKFIHLTNPQHAGEKSAGATGKEA